MPRDRGILVIGVAKLLKGVALLGLGVAALVLHRSERLTDLQHAVARLGLHPGATWLRSVVGKLATDDAVKIGAALLVYGALFTTEGTALLAGWHWAHHFAIGVTGSFIPIEVYELIKRPNVGRAVVLVLNFAILGYLIVRLKQRNRNSR